MKKAATMQRRIDISGVRFGRWIAIKIIGKESSGQCVWLCRCDCGEERGVPVGTLRGGSSLSCGCLKNEITSSRAFVHGMRHTPEYVAWNNMRQRCLNLTHKQYADYGLRGIKICHRWDNFVLFLQDLGTRPSPKHTIERRNNDGDYEPDNCYWATRIQQARNTRRNHFITWNGVTKCLTEWVEIYGANYEKIRGRIRIGWSLERALTNKSL